MTQPQPPEGFVPLEEVQAQPQPPEGFVPVGTVPQEGVGGARALLSGGATGGLDLLSMFEAVNPLVPLTEMVTGSPRLSKSLREAGTQSGVIVPDEQLTDEEKVVHVAGEVLGGGGLIGAAPLAIARGLGKKALTSSFQYMHPILGYVAKNPAKFAAVEAGSLLGAAQGAALAEVAAPDDNIARFVGEVAGGFLNPTGLVLKGVGSLTDFGTKAIKSLRKEGKELQAAEIMQEMLVEAGEDVDSVISALGRADEVKLTSGAKTGSPSLLAMERQLAAKNSEFSNLSEQIVKDAQEDIYKKINSLSKTGNPNDLRMASVAYDEFFDDLLMQKVSLAQKEASEALAKMSRGGTKASASVQAQNAIEKSLKDVRSVENALWSQIPKDVPLPQMSGMTNAFNKVRGELLAEEVVPFEKTFNRFMRKGVATVGDMVQLRKRLLAKARDLRANQKYDDARIHSELAGGVLRDLDSLDIPLATEARSFSRTLNDVFTRTFANKAKTRGATGELRLMPEMFLEGAFGSGGTKARVNFEALQKAARMGDASASYMGAVDDTSVGLLGSGLGGDVLNAQERFLAILANQTAKDGSINQAALNKFLNANSELLAKFPELKADIVDAKKAQELYERTVGLTKQASGAIGRRAAFSKVAGTENTVKAIGSILSGPEPTKRIGQLARLAKKSGEGASDGLYSAILEDSLNKSRTVDGVDFAKLQRLINNPISKGQPSINSLIKSNKIVSPDTTKRFDELVAKAVEVQDAIKSGKRLDEVIGDPDGVFDLVVRIAGANLGSMGAVGQGSPLIAGAAGSKFLRNIFHKVPASRLTDVLIEASVNPKFAQALLKKAPPMKQRAAYEKQINAFLLQSGIIEEEE